MARRKNKYDDWKKEDLVARKDDLTFRINRNEKTIKALGTDCPVSVIHALAEQRDDLENVRKALGISV